MSLSLIKIPSAGGGSGTVTDANQGTSLDGTTVVLGQSVGEVGDPAIFTEDREIPFNGFTLGYNNARFLYTNPEDVVHEYHLDNNPVILERIFSNSVTNTIPFERKLDANANGGPPDDLVYIQGFNIDGDYSIGDPSFTSRMEYKYTGSFYEYHNPQWSSPDGRVYRLLSFTFQDHGGVSDVCDIFMMGTLEMRALGQGTAYFNTSGGQSGATTGSSFVTQAGGTLQMRSVLFDDNVNPAYTIELHVGAAPLFFNNFSFYEFNSSLIFSAASPGLPVIGTPSGNGLPLVLYGNKIALTGDGDLTRLSYFAGGALGTETAYSQTDNGSGEWRHFIRSGGYYQTFYANGLLALTLDTSQNTIAAGAIQTIQPSAGGAGLFRVGKFTTGAVILDTANYIEVMIDGVIRKLLIST